MSAADRYTLAGAARVIAAAEALAEKFARIDSSEVWGAMSCHEVESVHDLMTAVGRKDSADWIVKCHAETDEEDEREDHDENWPASRNNNLAPVVDYVSEAAELEARGSDWIRNAASDLRAIVAADADDAEEATEPEGPTCSECGETFDPVADLGAGWGMCASCVHNARRSGWNPGE
jgi:hypothetical protein